MTALYFTLAALPRRPDRTFPVHMWLTEGEPTNTDSPGDERRAAKDAKILISDIVGANKARNLEEEGHRLLESGAMPPNAVPIFTFALGIAWDRKHNIASYRQLGYRQMVRVRKFAPVFNTGAELYEYTYSVVRKREKNERAAFPKDERKFAVDRVTLERARAAFEQWADGLHARQRAAWKRYIWNRRRFGCDNYRNGYCTPICPWCGCYSNGRCEEAKA